MTPKAFIYAHKIFTLLFSNFTTWQLVDGCMYSIHVSKSIIFYKSIFPQCMFIYIITRHNLIGITVFFKLLLFHMRLQYFRQSHKPVILYGGSTV